MRKRIPSHVTMEQIVPHVTERYRKVWGIPEEHQSVGFISCDNEDVMWLAVDDATKKAKIEVVHAESVYGGVEYSWLRGRDHSNPLRRDCVRCAKRPALYQRVH